LNEKEKKREQIKKRDSERRVCMKEKGAIEMRKETVESEE
jgi:hypothetical protein